MAKKLSARSGPYVCPPKSCPRPADFARYPELMSYVRREWFNRMSSARKRKPKKEGGA